jgi:multimeric flavodoxin WrbA
MQRVYPGLRRADAVVIASPVYWFTVTAQAKLFIDRGFYALGGPEGHALAGRQLGLILTYGDSDPFASGAVNALHTFQDIARYLDAAIVGTVCGSAMDAGEIRKQQHVMDQAYELGKRLGMGT